MCKNVNVRMFVNIVSKLKFVKIAKNCDVNNTDASDRKNNVGFVFYARNYP